MSEPLEGTAGVVAPPPVIYAVALLAGGLLHRMVPVPLLPEALAIPVGAPLLTAGLALVIWSIVTFHRAGTPAPPTRPTRTLVTHGPFRYTRNPIYLGFTLTHLGLACWHGSLWLVVTLVPAVALIHHGVIRREERYLTRLFAEEYARYRARVPRWLPNAGRP